MGADTSMTDIPSQGEEDPEPKNALQWFILVFWAAVICAWSWYLSVFASWSGGEEDLGSIVLWVFALTPAALAVWKYPTGRLFRGLFALVAFALPVLLATDSLVRLLRD